MLNGKHMLKDTIIGDVPVSGSIPGSHRSRSSQMFTVVVQTNSSYVSYLLCVTGSSAVTGNCCVPSKCVININYFHSSDGHSHKILIFRKTAEQQGIVHEGELRNCKRYSMAKGNRKGTKPPTHTRAETNGSFLVMEGGGSIADETRARRIKLVVGGGRRAGRRSGQNLARTPTEGKCHRQCRRRDSQDDRFVSRPRSCQGGRIAPQT